jgi:cytochrome b561
MGRVIGDQIVRVAKLSRMLHEGATYQAGVRFHGGQAMSTAIKPYSAPQRVLHWLSALVVLTTIPAGIIMIQQGLSRSISDALFLYHKNVGVIILMLVAARIVYRFVRPAPPLPDTVPSWQRVLSHSVHMLLYVLLLVMAISGYVRVTAGGFPLEILDSLGIGRPVPRSDTIAETAKTIHYYVRYPLIALIALHLGAAAYHAIVLRDGVFSRMWRGAGA